MKNKLLFTDVYLVKNMKYKRLSWALKVLVFLGARLLDSRCLHYLYYLSLKLYSKYSVGSRMIKTNSYTQFVKTSQK